MALFSACIGAVGNVLLGWVLVQGEVRRVHQDQSSTACACDLWQVLKFIGSHSVMETN